MRILLAGVSVRALAQSAVRAGYDVTCLDFFGDSDLPPDTPRASITSTGDSNYSATSLPRLARELDYDAVAYVANLENYPEVVEQLASHLPVYGNSPETLKKIRNGQELITFCDDYNVTIPATLMGENAWKNAAPARQWLLKPHKSGGGHAIRPWDGKEPELGMYIQEKISGTPASAVFEANGSQCQVLGISEQLIGQHFLGAHGYRYCGNIFPLHHDEAHFEKLHTWVETTAAKLTKHFGLQGINGMDFMYDSAKAPVLLEVNPRPPASAELMETALGKSIFAAHVSPLRRRGTDSSRQTRTYGKAIVYAHRDVSTPNTAFWVDKDRKDIPDPGQLIKAGHPICTVYASAKNRKECVEQLKAAANSVRFDVGDASSSPQGFQKTCREKNCLTP